jgi:aryl-alcohol dehydrogenase (NADP+)
VLHQPGVTAPIIGATQTAHVDQAIDALTVHLSAEERRMLQEPYIPRP